MIEVSKGSRKDIARCLSIAKSLPDYFTSKAVQAISRDLSGSPFFVAKDPQGKALGFASIKANTRHSSELVWLAVSRPSQRQGIGTSLVIAAYSALRTTGHEFLLARTLSARSRYSPYAATRRFLKKAGFRHIDTLDPCPGWDPGNPCDVFIRII